MSTLLVWENVLRYSLQIGLLVGLAAFVPALLRLRAPGARLLYWHLLLAACLLLPAVRPWKPQIVTGTVDITSTVLAVGRNTAPARWWPSPAEAALALLAAGVLARLVFLGAGLARLARYKRHSVLLEPVPSWGAEAGIYLSADVRGPVTFGVRNPVILLPAGFPELDAPKQDAILCHEVLHVRRRDWVFTMTEELIRAVFWFHPAIWWLLGEIGLAREQAVDREAVEMTREREQYLDALLAMAGAATLDLAPAPLFLRKRHLRHRVASIVKAAHVSRTRLVSAMAAGLGALAIACWFVSGAIPLAAAPQAVAAQTSAPPSAAALPAAPVTAPVLTARETPVPTPPAARQTDAPPPEIPENRMVEPFPATPPESMPLRIRVGGNVQQTKLIAQPRPIYPPAAKAVGLQGVVHLQATIAEDGTIRRLDLLSGHPILAEAAMAAVQNWVYQPTLLNGSPVEVITQIDVNFTLSR